MVKNYDPATPDSPGPATRPCTDCHRPIPEEQARRTFSEYDAPLCQRCAEQRDQEIQAGNIRPAARPGARDPTPPQVTAYELYQTDRTYGRIYQAPEDIPLPPGAIPQGYHRPVRGGPAYQLFRMPNNAPIPGSPEAQEVLQAAEEAKYRHAQAPACEDAATDPEDPLDPEFLEAVRQAGVYFSEQQITALRDATEQLREATALAVAGMRSALLAYQALQYQATPDPQEQAKKPRKPRPKISN
jgi:hypothetical protein